MNGDALAGLRLDHGDPAGEARACRAAAALFDFSFVSRARVRGRAAARDVERFCGRPLAELAPGRIRYALVRGADRAVEADLTVWRTAPDELEVMSGRAADVDALRAACSPGTQVEDLSAVSAILAVQGPHALRALAPFTDVARLEAIPYFGCAALAVAGTDCLVGRLGYTGERGFELLFPAERRAALWALLSHTARPAGFSAIDMLRIEAGFVLFANECRLRPGPTELGLGALVPGAAGPVRMHLVCFRARVGAGEPVLPVPWRPAAVPTLPQPGTLVVTSACSSVHAGGVLGLGFVPAGEARAGARPQPQGLQSSDLELVQRPWWDSAKRRPRGPWSEEERAAARFAAAIDRAP